MVPFLRRRPAPTMAGPDRGTMMGYIEGTALPQVESAARMAEALKRAHPSPSRERRAQEISRKAQALRESLDFLKESPQ
jgi:hypothetical protein